MPRKIRPRYMMPMDFSANKIRTSCPAIPIPAPPYRATFRFPIRWTMGINKSGTRMEANVEHIIMVLL